MRHMIMGLAIAAAAFVSPVALAQSPKPVVVLVNGAFADTSSWSGVIKILQHDGYTAVAAAIPMRGLESDATYVYKIIAGIKGPIVLVGHSYGGSVISEAANGNPNVKALVYVAAFAPEAGETAIGLTDKFPGSTLGPTLAPPVANEDGGKDLYIKQASFHGQFAADVPDAEANIMAATQRPIAEAALTEVQRPPAWKSKPSWFVYGDKDKNIPPQTHAFMAGRAHAKQTIVVKGASHVVMISNPGIVAKLIETAATAK